MKPLAAILIIFLGFGLAGCATSFSVRRAQAVTPEHLASINPMFTTDHVVYTGSNAAFHYFYHSQLFGGGSYKVAREQLRMVTPAEYPLGTGQPVLLWGRFDASTRSWINPRSDTVRPEPTAATTTNSP